jgi:hypothetical protein
LPPARPQSGRAIGFQLGQVACSAQLGVPASKASTALVISPVTPLRKIREADFPLSVRPSFGTSIEVAPSAFES